MYSNNKQQYIFNFCIKKRIHQDLFSDYELTPIKSKH